MPTTLETRLFPIDLPSLEWRQFEAAGSAEPVAGVIFRAAEPPCCGVPLGGLGTGCLDLDARGVYGFSSIFNPTSAFPGFALGGRPRRLPRP